MQHKILQSSWFQIHSGKSRFPFEEHGDKHGACFVFKALQMKIRISPESATPSSFCSRSPAGLQKLPNQSFLEFGSRSNTNSESTRSTVFSIGANQTHSKCGTDGYYIIFRIQWLERNFNVVLLGFYFKNFDILIIFKIREIFCFERCACTTLIKSLNNIIFKSGILVGSQEHYSKAPHIRSCKNKNLVAVFPK